MKKALIFGYVVGVLLFSGFARADETQLAIQNISYKEGSWKIEISGPKKNLCIASPRPTLVPSSEAPNTMILEVVAEETGDMCAQAIGGVYSLIADIRVLVQQSGVLVSPHQVYTIKTKGYPFVVTFSGGDVMTLRQPVELTGVLMSTTQGQKAVVTDQNRIVMIDDSQVDSLPFMNKKVSLFGHFGPLQTNEERFVNPFRNQNILPVLPTQRLMVVKILPVTM
ncbi:MAG: hypothetical protein AB7N80_06365 [Bdellovibrionales bacterium]